MYEVFGEFTVTRALAWAVLGAVLCASPLYAQTAARLETLLEQPVVTWAEAADFMLEASDRADYDRTRGAFTFARENGWLPRFATPETHVRYGGFAAFLMKAFDIRGGLFYTLIGTPRHAYRELLYQNIIQGKSDPDDFVSGDDFLFILGRVLTEKSAENLTVEESQSRMDRETLAEEINTRLGGLANISARATAEGVTISLSNINFLANSAELSNEEKEKIKGIADILKTIPNKRLLVTGHTALAGTREERQRTSLERAQSVAMYLETLGARSFGDIFFQGHGADRPVADNDTPEGMAANRRVEITILD